MDALLHAEDAVDAAAIVMVHVKADVQHRLRVIVHTTVILNVLLVALENAMLYAVQMQKAERVAMGAIINAKENATVRVLVRATVVVVLVTVVLAYVTEVVETDAKDVLHHAVAVVLVVAADAAEVAVAVVNLNVILVTDAQVAPTVHRATPLVQVDVAVAAVAQHLVLEHATPLVLERAVQHVVLRVQMHVRLDVEDNVQADALLVPILV